MQGKAGFGCSYDLTVPRTTLGDGAMVITPDRVIYAGLLGAPAVRTLGSLTIYIARDTPFSIRRGDGPLTEAYLAVLPPNCPHEIHSADRCVWDLLLEPESIDVCAALRTLPVQVTQLTPEYLRTKRAFLEWLGNVRALNRDTPCIDEFFLGHAVKTRALDERVRRAVELIRARPCDQFSASTCARLTGLSFSRFVHLFKEQIGMTFRAFCAWKRARAVLPYVASAYNLTDLALQAGYPDSTHFSHSIRRIYGLRPRDIVAGSRRLTVMSEEAVFS